MPNEQPAQPSQAPKKTPQNQTSTKKAPEIDPGQLEPNFKPQTPRSELIRKILIWTAAVLLIPFLEVAVFAFSLQKTLGNSTYLKQGIDDAGLYQAISTELNTEVTKSSSDLPGPAQEIIRSHITDAKIQPIVESTVDSIYSYFEGKIAVEDISIDISSITAPIRSELISVYKKQYKFVPNKQIEAQVDKVLAENGLLGKQTITIADLGNLGATGDQASQDVQSITAWLKSMANLYQTGRWLWPVCLLVSLLLAAIIVLATLSRFNGIRRVGWIIAGSSLANIVVIYFAITAVNNLQTGVTASDPVGGALEKLGKTILADVLSGARGLSIGLLIIGIGTVALGYVIPFALSKRQFKPGPTT